MGGIKEVGLGHGPRGLDGPSGRGPDGAGPPGRTQGANAPAGPGNQNPQQPQGTTPPGQPQAPGQTQAPAQNQGPAQLPQNQAPGQVQTGGPVNQTGGGAPVDNSPRADVPNDVYRPGAAPDTSAPLRGEGVSMKRSVSELTPDLRQVRDLPEVQNKFSSDYSMVAKNLVHAPETPPQERAQRAFEYFSNYAKQFVAVANRETDKLQPPKDPNPAAALDPGAKPQQPDKVLDALPRDHLGEQPTAQLGKEPPKDPGALAQDGKGKGTLATEQPMKSPQLANELVRSGKGADLVQDAPKPRSKLEMLEMQQLVETPDQPSTHEAKSRDIWNPREVKKALEEQGPKQEKQVTPQEREALAKKFAESLKDVAFDQIWDQKTGKDGVQSAFDLLMAKSLKEFEKQAAQKEMTAGDWPPLPPNAKSEELVEEQGKPQPKAANEFTGAPPVKKEIGESPAALSQLQAQDPTKDGVETFKLQPLAAEAGKVLIAPRDPRELDGGLSNQEGDEIRTNKRLGPNMLFNWLHRFRAKPGETALDKAKWDQLSFGALMFLVFVTLVVIVLVVL